MRIRPLVLAALVLGSACVRAPDAAPAESDPAMVSLSPTAAPSASSMAPAVGGAPPAASAELPCPPENPRQIREGTAILNADPGQLPITVTAGGRPSPRLPVKFDQARAAAGIDRGDFSLWLDGETWHLRANGKGKKPGTLFQARVEWIRDVGADGPNEKVIFYSRPRLSPGRCWNDPPVSDPELARTGFDWPSTNDSVGIRFEAPASGCFVVQLRVAEKEALPNVFVGSQALKSSAALQDSIELCR